VLAEPEVLRQYDVLMSANSIYFLTSRREYRKAIAAFHEVLNPGGVVAVMTPNRYHPEEATTGLTGVQFLPDRIAEWYVQYRGARSTYADVRLPSSFELQWWFRRAGFEDATVVDAYQFTDDNWQRHFKPRFYLTARKPE